MHFTCPECGEPISLPEAAAIKRTHCPHCFEIVLVPRPARIHRRENAGVGLLCWLGEGISATSQPGAPERLGSSLSK